MDMNFGQGVDIVQIELEVARARALQEAVQREAFEQFAWDHPNSADEGIHSTPLQSSEESSDSSNNGYEFWIRDHGFASVDELFETDDEDVVDRLNRREAFLVRFNNEDDDEILEGSMSPAGSIDDFVSSIWEENWSAEQDLGECSPEEYDSGEEGDDEDDGDEQEKDDTDF